MSAFVEVTPELLSGFLDEAPEYLSALDEGILQFETAVAAGPVDFAESSNADRINAMFRAAHSLKGLAATMGFDKVRDLTHVMETLFDQLRTRRRSMDGAIIAALLEVVDTLRALIVELDGPPSTPVVPCDAVARLTCLLESPTANPVAAFAPPATTEAPRPAIREPTPAASRPYNFVLDDPELSEAFVESTLASLDAMSARLLKLDGSPDDERRIDEMCHDARNIKNATGAAGIDDMHLLSSDMESVLHGLHSSATGLDDALVDTLLATVDRLHAALERIREHRCEPVTGAGAHECPADGAATTTSPAGIQSAAPAIPKGLRLSGNAPVGAGAIRTRPCDTVRVDVARMDRLMELCDELDANFAQFSRIHSGLESQIGADDPRRPIDNRVRRIGEEHGAARGTSSVTGDGPRCVRDRGGRPGRRSYEAASSGNPEERMGDARGVLSDRADALHALERIGDTLRNTVVAMRMVPIGPLLHRFHRVVRDLARSTNKEVELICRGESVDLDKLILDKLGDPLTHLVRNCVDHGVEPPDDRERGGKTRIARVTLDASQRGGFLCLEVRDDGRGIDTDAIRRGILERGLASHAEVRAMTDSDLVSWVLRPGFTTARVVTDRSGRGMGMDIVTTGIKALNGTVHIESVSGSGTVVALRIPMTVTIVPALLSRIGATTWAVPVENVAEVVSVPRCRLRSVQNRRVIAHRDRIVSVAFLEELFGPRGPRPRTEIPQLDEWTLVVLVEQDEMLALVVNEVLDRRDLVMKRVSLNYRDVPGIAGTSILGDGTVTLVLDVAAAVSLFAGRDANRAGIPGARRGIGGDHAVSATPDAPCGVASASGWE